MFLTFYIRMKFRHPHRLLFNKGEFTDKESYQWYEFAVTKVLEKGQVVRLVGSMKNIEEQKKQEEERLELRIFIKNRQIKFMKS